MLVFIFQFAFRGRQIEKIDGNMCVECVCRHQTSLTDCLSFITPLKFNIRNSEITVTSVLQRANTQQCRQTAKPKQKERT